MAFQAIEIARSFEQVVQQIEERIQRGILARGQKLPTEQELARQFGVSRSVVREAIAALGTLGLVESRQGSGTYVRRTPVPPVSRALTLSVEPDDRSILALFEFREPLEVLAAQLAAVRRAEAQLATIQREVANATRAGESFSSPAFGAADWAFHAAISEASGNPYLHATLNAIREMQRDVIRLVSRRVGRISIAAAQHARIADAIADGAADTAAAAMREHIGYSADGVRRALEEAATGQQTQAPQDEPEGS